MTTRSIPLGFEVGTGTAVAIPLKHLAITGQTQEAGKTTALEALIARSGLRAVTFITKRGESSFTGARRIDPYFREQADWQFVASILEASRGEKLKFERAWIIRASKGARTLADVQRNVRTAMETAKGMSADVYLTLDAYLEAVVPQIARVRWAPRLELAAGVNAMDLTGLNVEMQHLVIKSSLDWVLEKEEHTVVVIPEAWKFIPQGRGTPVKLAAEAFIRQGAGLKNFVWLDSQDIAGIEKIILKSVPLWILGVQREANEIKRTLDNIPAGIAKPSKADIATLELGQFYACWGRHAIKTYVQPTWMDAAMAANVAVGTTSVEQVVRQQASIAREATAVARRFGVRHQEETVTNEEAARLTRENETLLRQNADLRLRIEALEKGQHDRQGTTGASSIHDTREPPAATHRTKHPTPGESAPVRGRSAESGAGSSNGHVDEALYQALRARILEDEPILLKALTMRSELVVEVTPRVVAVDGLSVKGRVARLMAAGWFAEPRAVGAVRKELARTGADPGGGGALGILLGNLVKDGFLVRDGAEFVFAPGVKVSERELATT